MAGEVQAVNTPSSSLHWVGSLALKEKLAEVELVGLGFAARDRDGRWGGVDRPRVGVLAGVAAASVALTVNVCDPSARLL